MFVAVLLLAFVHLTSTTSQRHRIDQEPERVRNLGTFDGQVSSSDATADHYGGDEEYIALDSIWLPIRLVAPPAAKRAPWAPNEVRFDQLVQRLRSQTYKNRDKHSAIGTATDVQHLRRRQRRAQTLRDVIAAERVLVPVDDEDRRATSVREHTSFSNIAGVHPVESKRRRPAGAAYRMENGIEDGGLATSDQQSYPVYVVSGSSDEVPVQVLGVFIRELLAFEDGRQPNEIEHFRRQ